MMRSKRWQRRSLNKHAELRDGSRSSAALRRLPIVGTFPSHTAEMIRTTIGRIRLARSEMSDSNPKSGQDATMMGLAIMLGLPSIATIAFKSLSGISDEEEEAIRRMLPF